MIVISSENEFPEYVGYANCIDSPVCIALVLTDMWILYLSPLVQLTKL